MASKRVTTCSLFTSRHPTGLKFFPYTFLPFTGLYGEDGEILRGTEGEARSAKTQFPAKATAAPKNCCDQLTF